jgi:phage terminase large subunit
MSEAIKLYAREAARAGVPSDTVMRLLRYGIILQPKQLLASAAARECDFRCERCQGLYDAGRETPANCTDCGPTEVGYGGARAGGKSHWGMAQLVDDCLRFPGLKCLVLRRVGKAGKENFDDLRRRMLSRVPHDYKRQEGILIFNNGSRIVLGHFKDEKDIDNYLGIEYDVALVEEATQLAYAKYRDIKTCVRSSKRGWRPRMYSTTNPGGVGHAWYKELLVDPWKAEKQGKIRQTFTRFIPATVYDNRQVNSEYRRNLETLTGWLRRAWLDGDWDIAVGQFYTTFRADVHVLPHAEAIREIPPSWDVWMSMDYGFTHFTVAYLFAGPKGENQPIHCLAEHAQRRWLPERHAEAIKGMWARFNLEPWRIEKIVIGADAFNKDRDGGCVAEDYRSEGIDLRCANMDRVNGAAEILARLGDVEPPEGREVIPPRLYINPECTGLVVTLPALEHDPHRPEDVLKVDCDDEGRGVTTSTTPSATASW